MTEVSWLLVPPLPIKGENRKRVPGSPITPFDVHLNPRNTIIWDGKKSKQQLSRVSHRTAAEGGGTPRLTVNPARIGSSASVVGGGELRSLAIMA